MIYYHVDVFSSEIQEYLNRALGYCPDMQIVIESLKQAYKKEDEALQRLVEFQGGISLKQTVKHFETKISVLNWPDLSEKLGNVIMMLLVFLDSHFEIITFTKVSPMTKYTNMFLNMKYILT
jgi:hypothetical protein